MDTALRHHAAIGDRLATLIAMAAAARILAEAGRPESAPVLGAAAALREQAGPSIWAVAQPDYERAVDLTRASLSGPVFVAAFDEGRMLHAEAAIAMARTALATLMTAATPATLVPTEGAPITLTPREQAVMGLVAAGQTDREVAAVLGLRVRTVNTHVANVRRKLGVSSRTAAAIKTVPGGLR